MSKIMDEAILKYNKQIPRYTSYPTAPHFKKIETQTYHDWLKFLTNNQTISLYFHIPFCEKLCYYCGCYTKATKKYAPIADYLNNLMKEIKIIGNLIKDKNIKVSHLHFGGGSPTIVSCEDFENIMRIIKNQFYILNNAEIAIEIDPRNINEEKVKTYVNQGVNRVSIGVQDFNHDVQLAINRIQTFETVKNAVNYFRKFNIKDINFDLIYGLPKQTLAIIEKNIDCTLLLEPERIALFSYANVKWIKKHMKLINDEDLPNAEEKIKMYNIAKDKLIKAGYQTIGLDHFAKNNSLLADTYLKKKLKRNFQGYSTDSGLYIIGFGVSAISYLENGYIQNCLDFNEYKENVSQQKLSINRGIALSNDDKIRKRTIEEIMCYLEVDLEIICKEFSVSNNYFSKELTLLQNLAKENLIKIDKSKIIINPTTPQIIRVVASYFDKYLEEDNKKHSQIC